MNHLKVLRLLDTISLLGLLAILMSSMPVLALGADSFSPPRVQQAEVKVDGDLSDPAWQEVEPITSWYRLTPDEGKTPSEKTTMWLTYDDEAIYLAARLEERDISATMTRSLERDSYSPQQDGICILLDAFNDNRSAYGFIITPAGVRTDIAVYNDGEGFFRPWNTDWNTFWDAEVQHDSDGWSAEMRIPFSSLRFEDDQGNVEMGLILWRYLARNSEYDVFPEIPNRWRFSAYKPSKSVKINFQGVANRKPFYLKPYNLAGVNDQNLLRSDNSRYGLNRDLKYDAGLDAKYNLTSNLILDATLNTDFAQVEVDNQRINTSRFSLFFPEKRDFFQEKADLFTVRFPGGPQRLFHSRKIGIADGQTVPILGGMRLTGRVAGWEIGLIEMQTDRASIETDDGPEKVASENFGVLRLRREVFHPGSYIGGMVTTRTDFDGQHNVALAADGDIRIFGPQYVSFQLVQSLENGGDASRSRFASAIIQRRMRRGFVFAGSISTYGPDFNPGIGFVNRTGINRVGQRSGYTWFPGSNHILQNHSLVYRSNVIWGNDVSSAIETIENRLSWDALTKSGAKIGANFRYTHEQLLDDFSVGDIDILPGKYRFPTAAITYASPAGDAFRWRTNAQVGGYFGGWQTKIELSPSLTLSRHLAVSIDYEHNRIEVDNVLFRTHLLRLRVQTAFNRVLSIKSFLQLNSNTEELAANVRLRYNPTEGSDLYVVYNSNLNLSLIPEDPTDPRLPRTRSRSLLLKYTYTFVK